MQRQNAQAWSLPSVRERPEFGTTASRIIRALMPSRGALRGRVRVTAWQSLSVVEVESRAARAMPPSPRRPSTRPDCARSRGSLGAIYQEGRSDDPNAMALPARSHSRNASRRLRPGSGKSTSAKAFMVAVAREGLKDKYPLAVHSSCSISRLPLTLTRN